MAKRILGLLSVTFVVAIAAPQVWGQPHLSGPLQGQLLSSQQLHQAEPELINCWEWQLVCYCNDFGCICHWELVWVCGPPPELVPWDGRRLDPVLLGAIREPFFNESGAEAWEAVGIDIEADPAEARVLVHVWEETDGVVTDRWAEVHPFAPDAKATVEEGKWRWYHECDAEGSCVYRVEESVSGMTKGMGSLSLPVTPQCDYCFEICECTDPPPPIICWCRRVCFPPGCVGIRQSHESGDWVQEHD